MAKIVLRKLTARGDDSAAVEAGELPGLLHQEFGRGYSAAVKSDVGEARFIGNQQAAVLGEVLKLFSALFQGPFKRRPSSKSAQPLLCRWGAAAPGA